LFSAAIHSPSVKSKYAALGFFPGGQCGADFAAILREDYEVYGRIIREAHIKLD
jgi:tripartite-type tricarboxylate transporter receptor subunit TctC